MASVMLHHSRQLKEEMRDVSLASDVAHEFIQQILVAYFFNDRLFVVKEIGPHCHSVTFVMEEINHGLEEQLVSYIGRALCRAVQHLHDKRIIHRDIKGPNVLINSAGAVKLAGLETCVKLKNIKDLLKEAEGTPHWMAPEADHAALYNTQYNYKVDIWSLGTTILEMAEGHPPHHTKSADKLVGKISMYDPPKLAQPNLFHQSLSLLLQLCLQRSAEKRPDAGELVQHPFFSEVHGTENDVRDFVQKFDAGLLSPRDAQPFSSEVRSAANNVGDFVQKFDAGLLSSSAAVRCSYSNAANEDLSASGGLVVSSLQPQVMDENFANYERETNVSHGEHLRSGPEGVYKYTSGNVASPKPSNSISLSQIVRSTFYGSEACNKDSKESDPPKNFNTSVAMNGKFDSQAGARNPDLAASTPSEENSKHLSKRLTSVSYPRLSPEKMTAKTTALNENASNYEAKSDTMRSATPNLHAGSENVTSTTTHENLLSSNAYSSSPCKAYSQLMQANLEGHKPNSYQNSSYTTTSETISDHQPYSSSNNSSTESANDASKYSSSTSNVYRPYSASSLLSPSAQEPLAYIPYKPKTQELADRSEGLTEYRKTTSQQAESPYPEPPQGKSRNQAHTSNKYCDAPVLTAMIEQVKAEHSIEQQTSASSIHPLDLPETQRSPNDDDPSPNRTDSTSNSGARNKFNRRKRMEN